MNKLKLIATAALAAATIGIGGLATAQSASAAPARVNCKDLAWKVDFYYALADQFFLVGDVVTSARYSGMGEAFQQLYFANC